MLTFSKIFDGWDGISWRGILILLGIETLGDHGSVGMLTIGT